MRRFCSREALITIVVVGVLAAILIPSTPCGSGSAKQRCRQHLLQLHALGTAYASQHKGNWPDPRSDGYWLFLARTNPPYIEADYLDLLLCPLCEPLTPEGGCDYRGPRVPLGQLALSDPIAADRPGNHGTDPIFVLQ